MDFSEVLLNPWVVTIGGGLVLAAVISAIHHVFRRRQAGRSETPHEGAQSAVVHSTDGVNIANAGTIRDIHVGAVHSAEELAAARLKAEKDELDQRDSAARGGELVLTLLIGTLETSLASCNEKEPISEQERGQVESARFEWNGVKPTLAVLRGPELVDDTEAWVADVEWAYDEIWGEQADLRNLAVVPGATRKVGFAGPIFETHRMRIKRLLNEGKGIRNRYTALTRRHP